VTARRAAPVRPSTSRSIMRTTPLSRRRCGHPRKKGSKGCRRSGRPTAATVRPAVVLVPVHLEPPHVAACPEKLEDSAGRMPCSYGNSCHSTVPASADTGGRRSCLRWALSASSAKFLKCRHLWTIFATQWTAPGSFFQLRFGAVFGVFSCACRKRYPCRGSPEG
jgi:hypothetical protein